MKNEQLAIQVRLAVTSDDEWVQGVLKKYSMRIISKGRVHDAGRLPGFIAQQKEVR